MNYLCKRCTIVTEITASLLPKVLHCCYRKHCTFIYRNYCILSYRYHLNERDCILEPFRGFIVERLGQFQDTSAAQMHDWLKEH